MTRIEPRFDVIMWNDPAISVGTKVANVATMPYDGVLVGALFKGAGAEGVRLSFSDGSEDAHIPAVDIAIDTDALGMRDGPSPGKEFNGFTSINQPLAKGTKIDIIEEGTGTAEGNLWLLISETATGPYILNKAVLVDISSSVLNDVLMDCPTFMNSLKRVFVRGQGANDLTIQLGVGGKTVVVPCRGTIINTDIQPWAYHSIDCEVPDQIVYIADNGFTTTDAWIYVQFE